MEEDEEEEGEEERQLPSARVEVAAEVGQERQFASGSLSSSVDPSTQGEEFSYLKGLPMHFGKALLYQQPLKLQLYSSMQSMPSHNKPRNNLKKFAWLSHL